MSVIFMALPPGSGHDGCYAGSRHRARHAAPPPNDLCRRPVAPTVPAGNTAPSRHACPARVLPATLPRGATMLTDWYGLPLSTASSAAREAYVHGCQMKVTMYPGAI